MRTNFDTTLMQKQDDSDVSAGQRYSPFQHPEPDVYKGFRFGQLLCRVAMSVLSDIKEFSDPVTTFQVPGFKGATNLNL